MLEKKSRKVFSDIDLRTSAAAVDVEVEHFLYQEIRHSQVHIVFLQLVVLGQK